MNYTVSTRLCRSLLILVAVCSPQVTGVAQATGGEIASSAATARVAETASPARLSSAPEASAKSLTVDDVIRLVRAGLSDDLIIATVRKDGKALNLSTDDLIRLKRASVSDAVIRVMINPGSAPPPSSPGSASSPNAAESNSAVAKSPVAEIGVYFWKHERWKEVLPEVVTWRTGGVLKHIVSAGIVKGDVNGVVRGPHSRNSISTPVKFVIRLPAGVAITEYQLLRLHEEKDRREFRAVTGGVLHVSGGAARDLIPFEGKKITPHTYEVLLPNLGAGDYGFLPPGAFVSASSASMGKMYTFRVIE